MCVVVLSGSEPVDILVVCLLYCLWRSNYKSWAGIQFTHLSPPYVQLAQSQGRNFNAISRGLFVVCSIYSLFPLTQCMLEYHFRGNNGFYKKLCFIILLCSLSIHVHTIHYTTHTRLTI